MSRNFSAAALAGTSRTAAAATERNPSCSPLLRSETIFDPSRPSITLGTGAVPSTTTNRLWREFQVPTTLIEQRIGNSPKLNGRLPVTEDRLMFGPQLLTVMLKAVEY